MKIINRNIAILTLITIFCLSFVGFSANRVKAELYNIYESGDFSYMFSKNYNGNDGISIVYYSGNSSNVKIPYKIDNNIVTGLCEDPNTGDNIFANNNIIRSISIPRGITYLYADFFSDCDNLKTLKIYNKDCLININNTKIPRKTVLYGYYSSTTQKYAKENGYEFKCIIAQPKVRKVTNSTRLISGTAIADGIVTVKTGSKTYKVKSNGKWHVNLKNVLMIGTKVKVFVTKYSSNSDTVDVIVRKDPFFK